MCTQIQWVAQKDERVGKNIYTHVSIQYTYCDSSRASEFYIINEVGTTLELKASSRQIPDSQKVHFKTESGKAQEPLFSRTMTGNENNNK